MTKYIKEIYLYQQLSANRVYGYTCVSLFLLCFYALLVINV